MIESIIDEMIDNSIKIADLREKELKNSNDINHFIKFALYPQVKFCILIYFFVFLQI